MSTRGVLRTLVVCIAATNLCTMAVVGRPDAIAGQAKGGDPVRLSYIELLNEDDSGFVDEYSFEKMSSRQAVDLMRELGDNLAVTDWYRPTPTEENRNFLAVARVGDNCTAYINRGSDSRHITVMLLSHSALVAAYDLNYEDARSFFILRPHQNC